jgi:hypothetical protein
VAVQGRHHSCGAELHAIAAADAAPAQRQSGMLKPEAALIIVLTGASLIGFAMLLSWFF